MLTQLDTLVRVRVCVCTEVKSVGRLMQLGKFNDSLTADIVGLSTEIFCMGVRVATARQKNRR